MYFSGLLSQTSDLQNDPAMHYYISIDIYNMKVINTHLENYAHKFPYIPSFLTDFAGNRAPEKIPVGIATVRCV